MGTTAQPADEPRIEYMALDEVLRAPRNAKDHDLGQLSVSFSRFGLVMPPLLNETSGRMVAGHGRLDTLEQKYRAGEPPPQRVRVRNDGMWMIPVIRGIHFASDDEAEAYLIADNRLTELGGWQQSVLAQVLADQLAIGPQQLEGTGYDAEDVDDLLRDLDMQRQQGTPRQPAQDADGNVQTLVEKWQAEDGALWTVPSRKLGGRNHVLLCGRPNLADDLDRAYDVAGRHRIRLVVADPPYETPGDPELMHPALRDAFGNVRPHADEDTTWYVWTRTPWRRMVREALAEHRLEVHQEIVWKRDEPWTTDGDYQEMYEVCLYAWREKHNFYADRKNTTVWTVDKETEDMVFPGSKPVELMRVPIVNSSRVADTVYLPYANTGPGITAAESCTRIALAIEPDVECAAMALERASLMGMAPERRD